MDQSSATASRPSSANNQPEALNAVYTVHEKVTIAFNDSDKRYLVDKTALIKVDGFFKSCLTLGLKEAETDTVTIHDLPPAAVKQLILYIVHPGYHFPHEPPATDINALYSHLYSITPAHSAKPFLPIGKPPFRLERPSRAHYHHLMVHTLLAADRLCYPSIVARIAETLQMRLEATDDLSYVLSLYELIARETGVEDGQMHEDLRRALKVYSLWNMLKRLQDQHKTDSKSDMPGWEVFNESILALVFGRKVAGQLVAQVQKSSREDGELQEGHTDDSNSKLSLTKEKMEASPSMDT